MEGRRSIRSLGTTLVTATATATALALAACATPAPAPAPPPPKGPSDLVGEIQQIRAVEADTLMDLARNHDLGYLELVAANPGVDPWLPGERQVTLPKAFLLPPGPRRGIVINLAEQRLFLFREGQPPQSYPIGISRDGWRTPLGETKIVRKKKDPTWYPGPTARVDYADLGPVVPPGPDNPLGTHALYTGWQAILIHGTNEPYGIGRRVSRGCIRLYPEDIVELFAQVEKGMPVRVINEPILMGWNAGELYLEAHLTLDQASELEEGGAFEPAAAPPELRDRLVALAGEQADRIDWAAVEAAIAERRGVPVRVTRVVEPPPPPTALEALWSWLKELPPEPRYTREHRAWSDGEAKDESEAAAAQAPAGSEAGEAPQVGASSDEASERGARRATSGGS